MKEINIILALIAFLALTLGLVKKYIDILIVSEPLISLIVGILIGPAVFGWVDPSQWEHSHEVLHQASRFTLSLALMSAVLRLSPSFMKNNVRSFSVMLFGGMALMLFFVFIFFWFFGFSIWESILIGAILTPTDPVLATTIVSGFYPEKHVPLHMRNMLTAESASNDALAFMLVLLPLFFLESVSSPLMTWFTEVLLWQNLGAIVVGMLVGYVVGRLFKYFNSRKVMVDKTLLALTLSLTLLVTTSFSLIEVNGIIGVFAAGFVFKLLVEEKVEDRQEKIQSMIERVFIIPVFILLGMMLPWNEWQTMSLSIWIGVPLLIILRRLPSLYILKPWIPIFSKKDTFFAGWFGPIGIAGLFYITLITTKYPTYKELWPIATYAICVSTLIYAVSAYPFTKQFYGIETEDEENRNFFE